MLKAFLVGFLGALSALLIGAAIWFGVHSLDRPELVWAGSAFRSKQEFALYLKSNGLSYRTWLKRHPGVAPWEPGRPTIQSNEGGSTTEILLAVNAAVLAAILAVLCARTTFRSRQRASRHC